MYAKLLILRWGIVNNVHIVHPVVQTFSQEEGDPLQLGQLFIKARNLLDECFRQIIAGPNPIPVHLAFHIEECTPKSFREIGNICNTSDRQRLKRFVDENSYWIHIHKTVEDKCVLGYYVPFWIRDFFLNPYRCQHLYSTSLVIGECQKAIKSLILDPNSGFRTNHSLEYFFTPMRTRSGEIPVVNATHLLEMGLSLTDMSCYLKFIGSISTTETGVEDISPTESFTGCVLFS